MITGPVKAGKARVGRIVKGGLPGIWNSIVSVPLVAFASRIDCRREPAPPSLVVVTVKVAPRTVCDKKTKLASTAIPRRSVKLHNGRFRIRHGARSYHRKILVQGIGMGYDALR